MSLRGRLLAWSMALRSHARRVRHGPVSRESLADDLAHLAHEAETMAQSVSPEPAQIPDDGPEQSDLDLCDTQPIIPLPPRAKA